MKKWLQVVATLALAICAIVLVNVQGVDAADRITSTDGQWEYVADYFNNTCTVSAYKGDAVDLVIPSKIDGLTVKCIGGGFPENIVSVSIPSTVSSIGMNAFGSRKNLRKVNLPSKLEKIGEGAFLGCEALEDIRIPKNVSDISRRAFAHSGIKKLVVEGNTRFSVAKDIPPYVGAFEGCENLEEVSMPEYKGNSDDGPLFKDCTNLKEVNMPKVQVIPNQCFYNCQSLEKIKLPSCLKKIGSYAFQDTSLKNVDLPDTLNELGGYAFSGTKLSSLVIPCGVSGGTYIWDLSNIDIYVLNSECSLSGVSQTCTIHGFKNSKAYESAKSMGVRFVEIKGGISSAKGKKSGTKSVLSWKKAKGTKSYTIFRYNSSKFVWQKIATTKKTKYTDKSKSAGYKYKVTYTFKQGGKTLTGGIDIDI